MQTHGQEIEVKFLVASLAGLELRLQALGAVLVQPRVFERNLRFDDASGSLTSAKQVLRLRQDTRAVLTYKGPAQPGQSVSVRQEIETEVGDLDTARQILEALGYVVRVQYEKYRAAYRLGALEVTLDEMPFGDFCEIEGPDEAAIRSGAGELGLDWRARSTDSYLGLFDRVRLERGLAAAHLTFTALENVAVRPSDLGLRLADRSGEA